MTVKRITTNIAAENVAETKAFYETLFGLETVMDMGWIATLRGQTTAPIHLSIANEGGSNTCVPDLSIEVDDLDQVHAAALGQGYEISYGPATEPWGVRRFFLKDPAGKLVNVMVHET